MHGMLLQSLFTAHRIRSVAWFWRSTKGVPMSTEQFRPFLKKTVKMSRVIYIVLHTLAPRSAAHWLLLCKLQWASSARSRWSPTYSIALVSVDCGVSSFFKRTKLPKLPSSYCPFVASEANTMQSPLSEAICWYTCWHFLAKLHGLNAARTLFFTDLLRLSKISSSSTLLNPRAMMITKFIVQLALKAFHELSPMPASFESQYVPTNLERGPHPTSAGHRQMQLPWLSSGFWKFSFCRSIWVLAIRMENRTWKNSIFACAEYVLAIKSDWENHRVTPKVCSKCPLQLSQVALHTAGHCAGWDAFAARFATFMKSEDAILGAFCIPHDCIVARPGGILRHIRLLGFSYPLPGHKYQRSNISRHRVTCAVSAWGLRTGSPLWAQPLLFFFN